jgi:hypothetical protein
LITSIGGDPDPNKMYTQKDIQDMLALGAQPGGSSNFIARNFMSTEILKIKEAIEKALPGVKDKVKVNIGKGGEIIVIPRDKDGVVDEVNGMRITIDPQTNTVKRIDYGNQAVEPKVDPKTGEFVYKPVPGRTPEVATDPTSDQLASGNYRTTPTPSVEINEGKGPKERPVKSSESDGKPTKRIEKGKAIAS